MDKQTRILVAIIGGLAIICGAIISGMFLLKSVDLKNSEGSPGVTVFSTSSTGNTPSGGDNTTGTTQSPTTGGSGPIVEGDFLYSPGPVTGPAIVEFWNGQGGANDVCGTFQLPSGESFNYKAGHWWKYKSDQDMQADWSLHLALYNQKPENAPCTRGQRPPA